MTPYATVDEAAEYIDESVLDSQAWDEALQNQRQKALNMVTRAIDKLNFLGDKNDDDQEHQFPRGDDTVVPDEVKFACIEEALLLLDGKDPEQEAESLRIGAQGYGSARVTYDTDTPPAHIRSGIMSVKAWGYLLPFIRDIGQIDINR